MISASSFTVQPLYCPAYSASFFDMHMCTFSIHAFSFCAWLQIKLWDNWLKGSTCIGRKQRFTTLLKRWKLVVLVVPSFTICVIRKVFGNNLYSKLFPSESLLQISHWIYTCLVNKLIASHQKLLSYYETLWEEKGEISGSWKVRHPQQCVVGFFGKAWSSVCREKFWMMRRCVLEYVLCWHERTWAH